MTYENKQFSPWCWLGVCLCFMLLYLPFLGTSPLSRLEAIAAIGAAEPGVAGGRELGVVTYPLYPWLVTFCRLLVGHNEWAVRLPSFAAVLGLSTVTVLFARKAAGADRKAMTTTALMTFLPILMIISGRQASGHSLTAFLLCSAWFLWYWLGHTSKRWDIVWPLTLALVLAAAFHTGPRAFVLFYLPLFFLRRPFRIWHRLRMVRHLGVLLPVLAFYLYWIHGQIGSAFLLPLEMVLSEPQGMWSRLLLFPVSSFFLLLPAPFFFWPGFCAAFRTVETDREAASFLRTLIIPLFIFIWLLPRGYPADLAVLTAPLAVLAGMHYDILMRRFRYAFARFVPFVESVVMIVVLAALLFWVFVLTGIVEIEGLPMFYRFLAFVISSAAAATMATVRFYGGKHIPYCFRAAVISVVITAVLVSGRAPLSGLFNRVEKEQAEMLQSNLPPETPVYNLTSRALVKESFYLRRPVVSLHSTAALPVLKEQSVYVLGGYNSPLSERFSWNAVSELVDTTAEYKTEIEWLPVRGTLLKISRQRETSEQPPALVGVRIYQGNPRPEREESESSEE